MQKTSLMNILTVLIGTVSSQIITLLSITYASYHLGPEAIGVYTTILVIASPIGLLGTLRLETTYIFLNDGQKIFQSVIVALCTLAIISVFTVIIGSWILDADSFVYVGVLAFLLGCNACIINLSNYRKMFCVLAVMRTLTALFLLLTLLLFIHFQIPDALIFAAICGQLMGSIFGIILNAKWGIKNSSLVTLRTFQNTLKSGGSFSIFNGMQTIASALQETTIVMMITSFLGVGAVGIYAFATSVLRGPITIVAEAVGRVSQVQVLSNATRSRKFRSRYMNRFLCFTVVGAIVLFVCSFFWVGPVLHYILGEEWAEIVELTKSMSLYIAGVFIASTVAFFPLALGQPRAISLYGVFGTLLYICIVFIALFSGLDLNSTFWIVSIFMTFHHVLFTKRVHTIVTH